MKKIAFYLKRLDGSLESVKSDSNATIKTMPPNESVAHKFAEPKNSTAELLARVVKGVVSLVANLVLQWARKEDVRVETPVIGTIYGLFFAGLILSPLQPHRATATIASPQGDVEAQLNPWIIAIGGGLIAAAIFAGLVKGGKIIWEEIEALDGTIVAIAFIVVDSLDGDRTTGHTKTGAWLFQYKYGEDGASPFELERFYESFDLRVICIQ